MGSCGSRGDSREGLARARGEGQKREYVKRRVGEV